jgi:hypothetical protein
MPSGVEKAACAAFGGARRAAPAGAAAKSLVYVSRETIFWKHHSNKLIVA